MRNTQSQSGTLAALRLRLAALERAAPEREAGRVQKESEHPYPWPRMEVGTLHDLYAETAEDGAAVCGFGLGLAITAAKGRPVLWCLQDMVRFEAGQPHGAGLFEMGLAPRDLIFVRVRDAQAMLAVGEEALRSPAIGAVLLSAWGEARAFTLTASRRLLMAANQGGRTVFLTRTSAMPSPSAAQTRWSVAACPSVPLEGGAPGRPSFTATLLRHRGSGVTGKWTMEWDREQRLYRPPAPISGGLVPVAAQRPAAPPARGIVKPLREGNAQGRGRTAA